jgi:hypothetical protein
MFATCVSYDYREVLLGMHTPDITDDTHDGEIISNDNQEIVVEYLRRDLALIVTGLLVVIVIVATFQAGAMPVLDKMLPLVTLIFGFFFGQRARRS